MGLSRLVRHALGWLAVLALPMMVGGAARKAQTPNLLRNGEFEKRLTKTKGLVGWHTRLTSIIPVPEYTDPEHKKGRTGVTHFKCGCGYNWGTVRPWASLVCPQCKHMNMGLEDSGAQYQKNHESVSLIKVGRDRSLGINLSKAVGENQGVRVISDLVRAKRSAGYEISFDAVSYGPKLRVFVECFRIDKDDEKAKQWVKSLPSESNPLKLKTRLKRVFRKQVHAGSPGQWQRFSEKFVPPKRYEFDYMFVTLYAYIPGRAEYDNVVLRKLTRRELADYRREKGEPKEKRLR